MRNRFILAIAVALIERVRVRVRLLHRVALQHTLRVSDRAELALCVVDGVVDVFDVNHAIGDKLQ